MQPWFRRVLFVSGLINLLGAWTFIPSFGLVRHQAHFPEAPDVYLWTLAAWIFLFGACYLWLSFQTRAQWLFLVIGATGKLSFFAIFAVAYLAGQVPLICVASISSDLILGVIIAYWVFQHRNERE